MHWLPAKSALNASFHHCWNNPELRNLKASLWGEPNNSGTTSSASRYYWATFPYLCYHNLYKGLGWKSAADGYKCFKPTSWILTSTYSRCGSVISVMYIRQCYNSVPDQIKILRLHTILNTHSFVNFFRYTNMGNQSYCATPSSKHCATLRYICSRMNYMFNVDLMSDTVHKFHQGLFWPNQINPVCWT